MESRLKEKDLWGEAISKMRIAMSHINLLRKDTSSPTAETFLKELIEFCDHIRGFFNYKTGGDCCISIKVPITKVNLDDEPGLATLSFVNLCRDSYHNMRDNEKYKSTPHTVIGNTAYATVINNILKDYRNNPQGKKLIGYVNNNVRKDPNYKTTSPYDGDVIPYDSEIVFPLIPIKAHENKKYVLVGFLCIDCNLAEKFSDNRSYEIDFIETLADSLYDILYIQNETKQWK